MEDRQRSVPEEHLELLREQRGLEAGDLEVSPQAREHRIVGVVRVEPAAERSRVLDAEVPQVGLREGEPSRRGAR
ncbi:MAG: hypothetical protein R3B82_16085 [Sandaracinaceae bacterium]